MARPYTLSAVKAGMTRLLDKGGASRESLYELTNGYVNQSRRMVIRPGTEIDNGSLAGTFGLIGWRGSQWVFADHAVVMQPGYELGLLIHPEDTDRTLVDVPFAGPIAGALYVVGVFDNGDSFHYWLEPGAEWVPENPYFTGDLAFPITSPAGYYFIPERSIDEYPAWSAGAPRQVGDRVEPTIENGFYYEVVAVEGSNPSSGATEPVWPTNDAETVFEDTATGTSGGSVPPTPEPPGTGGGDTGSTGCVVVSAWLDPMHRAAVVEAGDWADLHDPVLGFHRGVCTEAREPMLAECVKLVTDSGAWLPCSITTPVNFTSAQYDKQDGHWAWAPDMLGHTIWVEGVSEIVVKVENIGEHLVKPLTFESGRSFAASGERYGRRIYTHNIRKYDPDTPL